MDFSQISMNILEQPSVRSSGGLEADDRIADEHAALHDRLVDSIEAHDEAGARLAAVEIVAVVRRVGGPSNID